MAYKRKFVARRYKKSVRGRFARRKVQRTFARRVKRVLLKASETKYGMVKNENQALYHDRGVVTAGAIGNNEGTIIFNPWSLIAKGTDANNRIGDEVYARGSCLRFMYWNAPGRVASFIRLVIAVIPKTSGTTVHDGTNYDFLDPLGSNDTVTGFIKKEGIKVLYDKLYTMNAQGSTDVTSTSGDGRFYRRIFIKSKKNQILRFQSDGTLANKPLAIWIVPYDEYGTLRTDILGSVSYTFKMYWKDV